VSSLKGNTMRVIAQILSAAVLAGVATAQSAPASQTVQSNPQPSKVQNGINAVKGVLKNPFSPKAKGTQPASQALAKPQVATKQQTTAPSAKQTAPGQAKATPASKQPAPVTAKASPKPKQGAPSQAKATLTTKRPAPVTAKASPKPKQTPEGHAKAASKVKRPAPVAAKASIKPKTITPEKKAEPVPVVAQSTPVKLPNPGKRDPFLSPIAAAALRGPAANCSTGKRCLVVDQIALKGVVQTKTGNIAMVENGAKRSYYLHENDALFDGSVVKITGDSVTFRQESSDILGRPVSKEVVKKVSAPAV
jgi:hypothetical protein